MLELHNPLPLSNLLMSELIGKEFTLCSRYEILLFFFVLQTVLRRICQTVHHYFCLYGPYHPNDATMVTVQHHRPGI